MKVNITIRFKGVKSIFYGNKIIDWPDNVFPIMGDIITVDDIVDKFGGLECTDQESKDALEGNSFDYSHKEFLFNESYSYTFYFGDYDHS